MDKEIKRITKTEVKEEETEGGKKITCKGVIIEIAAVKISKLLGVTKRKIIFEDGTPLFVNGIDGVEHWNWIKNRQVEVNSISNAAGITILSIDLID